MIFFVFGQDLENLAIVPGAGTAAAHGTVVQIGELVVDQAQQVEVAPSLVADCKKPLHQNRWFWGLGIGFFKSDENLRATFQNYFGERAL